MAVRLDVGKVILGAFVVPWWNRRAFFHAIGMPFVALVTLNLGWYYADEYLPTYSNWLLYLLYCVLFVVFAVTCHRLVLLNPGSVEPRDWLRWSWRETRFLLWIVAVGIIFLGAVAALSTPFVNVFHWTGLNAEDRLLGLSVVAGQVLASYLISRLVLVFPATAVDRQVNLKWAWTFSQNNGWRLFAIVAVLPWVISRLLGLLYRENASVVETVAITIAGFLVAVFEIAALSLSYRELTRDEPTGPARHSDA